VDRNAELNRLAQADRHIADAERNVSDQLLLIEKLRRDGHDIRIAEEIAKAIRGKPAYATRTPTPDRHNDRADRQRARVIARELYTLPWFRDY
jgi:hypothetical protein